MDLSTPPLFLPLLFVIALLYASVGHGGASGYLALMGLFAVETQFMKGSALLLNLFVAGISFYHYWRGGHFRWKLFYPFAITSIPFAFLGGTIELDPSLYKKILAIFLVFAILRILKVWGSGSQERKIINLPLALLAGAILGFFSGLIGIGGGIILSPLILLLAWGDIRETAAVSALFIWVNSAAGLSGMAMSGLSFPPEIYLWVVIALLGGMLGAWAGARKLNVKVLTYLLAVVLSLASLKLFIFS